MTTDLHLTVAPEEAGIRLDVWLTRRMNAVSRSRVKTMIQAGHGTLNGHAVKEHHKTRTGESVHVVIPPPEDIALRPEPIALDILYEDADIIIVNKPAGLVVHPAVGHPSGTLVNALLYYCPDLTGIGGERRPGLVHRLDKDTSGVLVAAKNENAMAGLVVQFKARQVEKHYLTLVWGKPNPPAGTIKTLIGRHHHDRKRMTAHPRSGRLAITRYAILEVFEAITLLRIHLITGRTHQIRVHMASRGHPVVGDRQYGTRFQDRLPAPAPRQMLHAEQLVLTHPTTGRRLSVKAPIPDDMATLLKVLRA